ncbi:hypothetical protein [Facklamia sp. 7083-14-GEN3]|uniref:hypothetical protein n=1 Tax=Facklamia sp. 7083-14-GEN3 TaxID=2973478 RepID=UPI00215C2273|nr:hypothetical protein [Facklamia sp. 7083-14-GEN3]MCR8968496.1 hypothetical protein [Facklamia sp. 7083-14-GEN3]
MNQMQGNFQLSSYLFQLIIILPASIILGSFILNIPKMAQKFVDFLRVSRPNWLVFLLGQFPPAIIFSFIMGLIAITIQGKLNIQSVIGILKSLPATVLIAVVVQILVTLLIDKVYKKWFFSDQSTN